MHVLIVGMRKFAIEECMQAILTTLGSERPADIQVFIAETFSQARASLKKMPPDIVHVVNEVGMSEGAFADGCNLLSIALECEVLSAPLVNFDAPELLTRCKTQFTRRRMPVSCGTVAQAVRAKLQETEQPRRAS